jgi:hypothetical protein
MGVSRNNDHAPNRQQAPDKLPVVVVAKLVTICSRNPRRRDIRRIEKEESVYTVESF